MYVRVYAPNGEPFDVSRDRADRLILEEGWTQTPPVIDTPTEAAEASSEGEEAPRKRARKTD